jgi:superfamily I DNA and RNA helicase
MDMEQEKLARNLGEGHRIIHGVAGSGKTLILAYRAMIGSCAVHPPRPIGRDLL